MKFPKPIPVQEIASMVGASLIGDDQQLAYGINEIHKVEPGDITFVDIEKYYNQSLASRASIILINKKVACPEGKTLLIIENPFRAYDGLVAKFRPFSPMTQMIDPSARIHPSATIEPNVMIGAHVSIGQDTYIQGQCYIGSYTRIGSRVNIQAGCKIGNDAFYFKKEENTYNKWVSGGNVVIEDDVFIGAACTINRGVSGSTIIGKGSILDCQIHVGHGVEIGENSLIAGQTGIGGKTIIGKNAKIYGQVGIINNLVIGDNVTIYAGSGISDNLESNKAYFGAPAVEARERFKEIIALRRISKSK